MYEELIKALRYCDLVVNKTEDTLQCGVCQYFERCSDLDNQAADALEAQTAQLAAKDAEIEQMRQTFKDSVAGLTVSHDNVYARLDRVTAERDAAVKDLSMVGKLALTANFTSPVLSRVKAILDKWRRRTTAKQDEEETDHEH